MFFLDQNDPHFVHCFQNKGLFPENILIGGDTFMWDWLHHVAAELYFVHISQQQGKLLLCYAAIWASPLLRQQSSAPFVNRKIPDCTKSFGRMMDLRIRRRLWDVTEPSWVFRRSSKRESKGISWLTMSAPPMDQAQYQQVRFLLVSLF